ncbi:MAG: helix-turn-helix domain-containing protein [Muribaculaceae bacterium]|nr:helix-turn-helix domain-containing protein [Muribaculaceae bacterium]
MTMIMVPEEEWRNLHDTLEQIIDLITRRNFDDSSCEWIESEEARKLLGISPKTWQNYRDQRLIPLSQIGRKIYVNRADLDDFLRSHQIAPKK